MEAKWQVDVVQVVLSSQERSGVSKESRMTWCAAMTKAHINRINAIFRPLIPDTPSGGTGSIPCQESVEFHSYTRHTVIVSTDGNDSATTKQFLVN